jgi:hypothetical protein
VASRATTHETIVVAPDENAGVVRSNFEMSGIHPEAPVEPVRVGAGGFAGIPHKPPRGHVRLTSSSRKPKRVVEWKAALRR